MQFNRQLRKTLSLLTLACGLFLAVGCQLIAEVDESRLEADAEQNHTLSDASDDPPDAMSSRPDAMSSPADASVDAQTDASTPTGSDAGGTIADASAPDATESPLCKGDSECPIVNDPCQKSVCRTSECIVVPRTDGTSCQTNLCLVGQQCESGVCVGGRERDCGELDSACTTGLCDEQTGACIAMNLPKGTSCSTNYCRVNQQCDGRGVCEAGNERQCTAPTCGSSSCDAEAKTCVETLVGCEIDNSCWDAGKRNPANTCEVCDPALNRTGWSLQPNGSPCNDGVRCTNHDTCMNGQCDGRDNCREGKQCNRSRDRCEEPDD